MLMSHVPTYIGILYIIWYRYIHVKIKAHSGKRDRCDSAVGGVDGHKIHILRSLFGEGSETWSILVSVSLYSIYYEICAHIIILFCLFVCVCNIVVVTITPPSAVTTYERAISDYKWVCCACARVAMTRLRRRLRWQWRGQWRRTVEVTAWAKSSSSIG